MKITRFNEGWVSKYSTRPSGDDYTYKGSVLIDFEVKRSDLLKNTAIYSDNFLKKYGLEGVLYNYVKHLDYKNEGHTLQETDNRMNYEIYDKDGNIVDKEFFDDMNKYNL